MTKHRQDNTFVIDWGGLPYHLTPDYEPTPGLYDSTLAAYEENAGEFEEELPPTPPPPPTEEELHISALNQEIAGQKAYLASTDYQAIKYAEGILSEEEYAPIRQARALARERINELEAELTV